MPRLLAELQDIKAGCVDFGADFEGLSHFLQAHYKLPAYHKPYFVGFESGAALGYALIAQAPTSTYAGVLSVDFCPDLRIRTPLCRGDDLRTAAHATGRTMELLPIKRSHTRWVVQPDTSGEHCDVRSTNTFLSHLPESDLITIRSGTSLAANTTGFSLTIHEAIGQLQAKPAAVAGGAATEIADLPLVEMKANGTEVDAFAVLLSGDGGWTGLDKDVAAALSARGIAVVGWDSLRYFWKARTPEELAVDADRIIRHYSREWSKSRVLLLGYSQGANVLPFLVNRLPDTSKDRVSLVAMTGLGTTADFEFHFANWVADDGQGKAVLPETARMSGAPAVCIYGVEDDDSACPQLDRKHVQPVPLPGGHHFNGNYALLAATILRAAGLQK
jgi:type IV secretory pathway VirJ component